MYKLVAVGGKLRGKEFELNDGENVFGRGADCENSLSVEGVSKKHMSVTVNGETAYVEDLKSSNGTFINGKLIKKATVKNGDKIALPNLIFQVVYVEEKKVIVTKKVAKSEKADEDAYDLDETMPKDIPGKAKFIFKNKLMPILYGFNEQYEWAIMIAILLFAFIAINIFLVIQPVLSDSKRLLLQEIVARANQYTNEVARINTAALSRRDLDRINTSFLESDSEGIQSYTLFDPEGRIVRPIGQLNSYINDSFSVSAKNHFKETKNIMEPYKAFIGDGVIGVAKAVLANDMVTGGQELVGIIAIRFMPKSLTEEASNNSKAYLESLITSALVAMFFFGMIYYLTIKPLTELRHQIEEVLRGKRKDLNSKLLMSEINPLRNTINSILQRLKELQSDETTEFEEIEEDGAYLRILQEFIRGAQGPIMVLNSEKLIENINPEAEDLVGMRESSASGTSLLDSARDQGFAATVIDLCDQSANNEGVNQSESYELGGRNHMIHITALMGKDNFAKAFYVTFVVDE